MPKITKKQIQVSQHTGQIFTCYSGKGHHNIILASSLFNISSEQHRPVNFWLGLQNKTVIIHRPQTENWVGRNRIWGFQRWPFVQITGMKEEQQKQSINYNRTDWILQSDFIQFYVCELHVLFTRSKTPPQKPSSILRDKFCVTRLNNFIFSRPDSDRK